MLGDANRFTTATFGWTVDVPAGLSLNVQICESKPIVGRSSELTLA